jgi:hypothetical protein
VLFFRLGYWCTSFSNVAIKKLDSKFISDIEEEFKREIEILHSVRFKHIIGVSGKD